MLDHDQVVALLLTLGTLLSVARLLGELASRLGQPAVVGELAAGILLGPTVLGRLAPDVGEYLFPQQGAIANALSGFTNLALVLFLLVAGMEVDLSSALRRGRAALWLGSLGTLGPFVLGGVFTYALPDLMGKPETSDPVLFALFMATALSISALPVIAKILLDLHILRSDLGTVIMAAAIFNDLIGWIIFAVILGLMGKAQGDLTFTILSTLGYWLVMMVGGRVVFHRALPYVLAYGSGPGAILSIAASIAFFGAAFTEWIGVHAIFGSFMVGVAIGDSPHLRQQVRRTLHDFVAFIFAPLFFASIGLHADFATHFDLSLFLVVTALACVGKIVGCGIGARAGGLSKRESMAAIAGMNARGAMEIILGLLALRFELIDMRVFVALVCMALLTSVVSGPVMQRILQRRTRRRIVDALSPRGFMPTLDASERNAAIRELCSSEALTELGGTQLADLVIEREEQATTSLGDGLAIPHARVDGLKAPVCIFGRSAEGVDFDAEDGLPAHLMFLLLTPTDDDVVQLELLADIARLCRPAAIRKQLAHVSNYTELRAVLGAAGHEDH